MALEEIQRLKTCPERVERVQMPGNTEIIYEKVQLIYFEKN